jgi:LemA protein
MLKRLWVVGLISVIGLSLTGCSHSEVPTLRERARQAWGQVINLYLERATQVEPLVEGVQERAPLESEVLDEAVAARQGALSVMADDGSIADGERFRTYAAAQRRLSIAIGELYETIERYPEITGDSEFMDRLRAFQELVGRLVVARSDLISAVRSYNEELTRIPDRWIAAVSTRMLGPSMPSPVPNWNVRLLGCDRYSNT